MLSAWAVFLVLSQAGQAPQSGGRDRPVPAVLTSLAQKAQLSGRLAAWCGGEFRAGHPGAFAAALRSPSGDKGRYVVLEPGEAPIVLGPFDGTPDLSCYTAAEARTLGETIGSSETIEGRIVPRWQTTVVCAFSDNTTAACWQYSPSERRFVKIGGWIT